MLGSAIWFNGLAACWPPASQWPRQLFCQIPGAGVVDCGKNQGILEIRGGSIERLNGSAGSYIAQAGGHMYFIYSIDKK
jgi:hypothetical protein